jgi:hypothetical protein
VADIRVAGERLVFDAGVWDEEVDRFDRGSLAHRSAVQARRAVERPGARVALRACDRQGSDGTRLAGHAKAYVPLDVEPSRARFGRAQRLRARAQAPARPLPRPVARQAPVR